MSLAQARPERAHSWPFAVGAAWMLGAVALLAAAQWLAVGMPTDQAHPLIAAGHLFTLALLAGMLWLGGAIGLRVLRALGLDHTSQLERALLGVGLGLGAEALLVTYSGLAAILHPGVVALLLVGVGVAVRAELWEVARSLPGWARAWWECRRDIRREPVLRLGLPLAELSCLLLVLRALNPPTGYDSVLYHLAGARKLLELGRLALLPEVPQTNFPFTVQMLYLIGVAFGSLELGNLLHLTFALLTVLAAYAVGRRLWSSRAGWIAALALLSAPALAVYGPIANVDYGWAFFDFMAVYAFILWMQGRQVGWLAVAGAFGGLSLGSKYLGVLTCACIGLAIVLECARAPRSRPMEVARRLLAFGLPAAAVAMPWYLKNWLWLGSPVWPFLAPQVPDALGYFGHQMNNGRTPLDYLLLPVRIFLGSAVELPAAIPPVLFLLLPACLFARREPIVCYLLALSVIHFVAWSQGIQTVRYLFPIFPALALVVAHALEQALAGGGAVGRAARWSVVVSLLVGTGAGIIAFAIQHPVPHVLGLESRDAYLTKRFPDYAALRYLNAHRNEVSRVLLVGDARLLYLETPALVDQGLEYATVLLDPDDPAAAAARLRAADVSHVLLSARGHLTWLASFDPETRVWQWLDGFERTASHYLTLEFADAGGRVYRVTDRTAQGSSR